MTTEERLENLEKELARAKRRNRLLLAAVMLGAGAVILAAAWIGTPEKVLAENAAKAPTILRANGFILEDENGKSHAIMSATKDGPALWMFDENGVPRAGLSLLKDEPRLALFDKNGKVRASLLALKAGPGLALFDENGKTRAELTTMGKGKDMPGLILYDENGKVRASLGADQTETPDGRKITYPESSMRLFNPEGKVIWAAGGAEGVAATPRQVTPPVEAAPPVKAAPQWRPCPDCNGSGTGPFNCFFCKGTGRDERVHDASGRPIQCGSCNGRGFSPCMRCNGKGMVRD